VVKNLSPKLGSLVNTSSVTAWGDARPLDVVMDDMAANVTTGVVELSIGAFPVGNPDAILEAHRDKFVYIGHHAMPVGSGKMVRPTVGNEKEVLNTCARFDLSMYTGHAPNRKNTSYEQMLSWAASYYETLADAGVGFAVETMYVPQANDEAVKTGGYHLAHPHEVFQFAQWANDILGWEKPLLVDASHLHIGYRSGYWTEQDIVSLMESSWVAELHISENNGKTDSHTPLTVDHVVNAWVSNADVSHIPIIVDEGRRRGRPGKGQRRPQG
jgi:hypothetical protein